MQISTIDLYANELKEKTIMGGFITALVWAATLVYLAILIFQVSEHFMVRVSLHHQDSRLQGPHMDYCSDWSYRVLYNRDFLQRGPSKQCCCCAQCHAAWPGFLVFPACSGPAPLPPRQWGLSGRLARVGEGRHAHVPG
jgi:hypothetical protein